MKNRTIILAGVFVFAMFSFGLVSASTMTLQDSENLYDVAIGFSSPETYGIDIRWDISTLPLGATIDNAMMCFYRNGVTGTPDADVNITLRNSNPLPAIIDFNSTSTAEYNCINVTDYFSQEVGYGNETIEFLLSDADYPVELTDGDTVDGSTLFFGQLGAPAEYVSFLSKNGGSNTPFVQIDYTDPTTELQLTSPTTASPISMFSGGNLTGYFNFLSGGYNATSSVTFESAFVDSTECTLIQDNYVGSGVEFNDTFTEASQVNLDAHTPSPNGTSWTKAGYSTSSLDAIVEATNDVVQFEAFSNQYVIYTTDTPETPFYNITMTLKAVDSSDDVALIVGRYTDDSNTYVVDLSSTASENHIRSISGGSVVTLATASTGVAISDVITFVVSDDEKSVYKNGVLWMTTTDNTLKTGTAGLGCGKLGGDGGEDCTVDWQLDDFSVSSFSGSRDQFEYVDGVGWTFNCTTPSLSDGYHDLYVNATYFGSFTANDTETNAINFVPPTAPYFSVIPDNATLLYGSSWAGVTFTANDTNDDFDSYSVNDTSNFAIDSNGLLTSVGFLDPGTYVVNITINDTTGLENSTLYQVDVLDYYMDITYPTTLNPYVGDPGDNVTAYFNFYVNNTNVTSGVLFDSVYVGNTSVQVLSGGTTVTDWYVPSSTGYTYDTFSDPTYAYLEDGNISAIQSYWESQDYYDFGISIPSGAIVNGIEVQLTIAGNGYAPDAPMYVNLSSDLGSTYTDWIYNVTDQDYPTVVNVTYGNLTYTWGRSWTGADLADANFMMLLTGGDQDQTLVDAIRIRVNYTDYQFAYVSGSGWQMNFTLPEGLDGFQDLFINATYTSDTSITRSDNQTSAISFFTNTAPSITANSTSPGTVYTDTDFLVSLTAEDAEEFYLDAYVSFYVDDVFVETDYVNISNATNTQVGSLDSSNFIKGQDIIAEVWVGDGTENTTKVNLTAVTVQNSAPVITTLQTTVSQDADGSSYTYDYNYSDVDGDTIMWYDNTTLFAIDPSTGIISDTPTESEAGSYSILITAGDGIDNTTDEFTYTINDVTPPQLSNFNFIAVDKDGNQIGSDETAFNTSNLDTIEYMNITFDLDDGNGIYKDIVLFYTANGTNACATGNKQSSVCYNFDSGTWIEYQNGSETSTFRDIGAQGDFIECSYTGTLTHREYTCQIDEHYNPNVFKWYDALLDFNVMKWEDGINQRISKNKMIKIEIDPTNIPLNADQYKVEMRVNYSTSIPVEPLEMYACNSSYTVGDPEDSQNCKLVGTKLPGELEDDGTKYRLIFTDNLFTGLNDVKYFILESHVINPTQYYFIKTYNATTPGWTTHWTYSINGGLSFSNLGDGYETEFNINWFNDGGVNPTATLFKVFSNDTSGNDINSSIQTMEWSIDASYNYAPILSIVSPDSSSNNSGNMSINWTVAEPNMDSYLTNITLSNSTTDYVVATELADSVSSYVFDTTSLADGTYNLTVSVCENDTADLFCVNDTHTNLVIDNSAPNLSIVSPSDGYNIPNYVSGTIAVYVNFSVNDDNLEACKYEVTGIQTIANTSTSCSNGYNAFTIYLSTYGSFNVIVYSNDSFGNENSDNFSMSISPYTGPQSGGGTTTDPNENADSVYDFYNSTLICDKINSFLDLYGNNYTAEQLTDLKGSIELEMGFGMSEDILNDYIIYFKNFCPQYFEDNPTPQDTTPDDGGSSSSDSKAFWWILGGVIFLIILLVIITDANYWASVFAKKRK